MLDLRSDRWKELSHAYGSAGDIPALLSAARSNPHPTSDFQAEPWFSLWSALAHQSDSYTASFAAVPHLVAIAAEASGPINWELLGLVVSIEINRLSGRAPAIPDDLRLGYFTALRSAPAVWVKRTDSSADLVWAQVGSALMAVIAARPDLADVIMGLEEPDVAELADPS